MKLFLISLLVSIYFYGHVQPGAVQVKTDNADSYLGGHELVFLNFYANWCRFSQMLEPIYDEFADKISKEYPAGKVLIGKVDCDSEGALSSKNNVNKYPTLKLFRHGVALKKEYRGARSVEAFTNFIRDQIADPLKVVEAIPDLFNIETKKRTIIGYFANQNSENYKAYSKLSSILRDSCNFVAAVGPAFAHKRPNGDTVVFRDLGGFEATDIPYDSQITNYDVMYTWSTDHCTPLVREITFENAEELTEEGLPFLILFHKPDDMDSVKIFEKEVQHQLAHEKGSITAVHADGHKFSHPLNHLGKSSADLPLLAIDSFRHMYLFPDFKKIGEENNLKQFVIDLHSGKLHREFHNGPDPTEAPKLQIEQVVTEHIPKQVDNEKRSDINPRSTPPESVFIKLAPGPDRYSIKHGDGGEL